MLYNGGFVKNLSNRLSSFIIKRQKNVEINGILINFSKLVSEVELAEIEHLRNKSFDELILVAKNGNRVALFMIGMYLLNVDTDNLVEQGYTFIALSASLGFFSALNLIQARYSAAKKAQEDYSTLFLDAIYSLCSLRQLENSLEPQYEIKKFIIKNCGEKIFKEIEKIALQVSLK